MSKTTPITNQCHQFAMSYTTHYESAKDAVLEREKRAWECARTLETQLAKARELLQRFSSEIGLNEGHHRTGLVQETETFLAIFLGVSGKET